MKFAVRSTFNRELFLGERFLYLRIRPGGVDVCEILLKEVVYEAAKVIFISLVVMVCRRTQGVFKVLLQ